MRKKVYQLRYDFKRKKFLHFNRRVMGHLVYRKIPKKVINICLHYPWPTLESLNEFNYPVGGAIDTVMREFKDKRVTFEMIPHFILRERER